MSSNLKKLTEILDKNNLSYKIEGNSLLLNESILGKEMSKEDYDEHLQVLKYSQLSWEIFPDKIFNLKAEFN